jgi:hypothetical protein
MKRTRETGTSPFLVRQELSVHRDDDAISLGILFLLHVQLEVNRAHDAVAEHLVDDRLEGCAVNPGDLAETLDERIRGHCLVERSLGRKLLERGHDVGSEARSTLLLPMVGGGIVAESV